VDIGSLGEYLVYIALGILGVHMSPLVDIYTSTYSIDCEN